MVGKSNESNSPSKGGRFKVNVKRGHELDLSYMIKHLKRVARSTSRRQVRVQHGDFVCHIDHDVAGTILQALVLFRGNDNRMHVRVVIVLHGRAKDLSRSQRKLGKGSKHGFIRNRFVPFNDYR